MAQWWQGFWGTASASGGGADDADPDGDFLEYAFGGDPTLAGSPPLPTCNAIGGKLALTFSRTLSNTDITMIVQAAELLSGPWTDLAASVNGAATAALVGGVAVAESGAGASRQVGASDLYFANDPLHPRRFLRVNVTHP